MALLAMGEAMGNMFGGGCVDYTYYVTILTVVPCLLDLPNY